MNTLIWGLLISCIIAIILAFKALIRLEKRMSQAEKYILDDSENPKTNAVNIVESPTGGLVRGIQQIRENDEKYLKLLELSRQLQQVPLGVMNQNSTSKSFNTNGELIPNNLTNEEREILKMYYDRSNER